MLTNVPTKMLNKNCAGVIVTTYFELLKSSLACTICFLY